MITAYVKYYNNDYNCRESKETYFSLEEMFSNWRKRSHNYERKRQWGYKLAYAHNDGSYGRIDLDTPEEHYREMFVYQLDNENGTFYSSGKNTNGEQFCAKKLAEYFERENDFIKNYKPNFVEI